MKIVVQEQEISIIKEDYISLTDIAKSKNSSKPKDVIASEARQSTTHPFTCNPTNKHQWVKQQTSHPTRNVRVSDDFKRT